MKNNTVNYGCLWIFIGVIIFWIIVICAVNADTYEGKEDIKPDGKKTMLYQHERAGRLLPYPTYSFHDSESMPKYWNGYGVKPSGANYYHYFDNSPCQYPEVVKCKKDSLDVQNNAHNIPEPMPVMLIGIGAIGLWIREKLNDTKEKIDFLWLFRAAWIEKVILAIAFLFVAFVLAWALTGCGSVGTITRFSDGTVSETNAFTFGSTAAVSDFKDTIGSNGRKISFGAGQTDVNVQALQQSNDLLGKIVEGFTSGAIKGVK
jgi:hypothetical protein